MQTNRSILNFVLVLVLVVGMLGAVAKVAFTAYTVHSDGKLELTTGDPNATLAISQQNKEAAYIGQGSTDVLVRPGTYLLSATDSGSTVMESVTISQRQTITAPLNVAAQKNLAQKRNALLSQLPFDGPAFTYKINYYLKYTNGQSTPVLTITAPTQAYEQSALQWMRSAGFNPSDYTIQYTTGNLVPSNYNAYVGGS